MKIKLLLISALYLITGLTHAQFVYHALVKDSLTGDVLTGVAALLEKTTIGAATDLNGKLEIRNIPAGTWLIRFSLVGYQDKKLAATFPAGNRDTIMIIQLSPADNELEEVIISATRTNSRIEAMPTRTEVIGMEDLNEENSIKPSGISSLLGDIAGVQLQQTSATTGNSTVRIQGLDGKYTQILYDGMPLFGGFSGSLGVLQIPPMDLKQIEIIKGASSSLHGAGAIAGLINLVPKIPVAGRSEMSVTINQTSRMETDINAFISDRNKRMGYTFFGGGMIQQYQDVNKDGFTDLPRVYNVFLHPSVIFYTRGKGMIRVSLNSNYLDQKGGDVRAMKNSADAQHPFFVKNRSVRNTLSVSYLSQPDISGFTARASVNQFYRKTQTNIFRMDANQFSVFSELNYLKMFKKDKLVAGLNLNGEFFTLLHGDSIRFGNSNELTPGIFVQNEWAACRLLTLEAGLRADYNTKYGSFLLPRINALFNISKEMKTRIGGGMGYGTPANFLNGFEEQKYPEILPLPSDIKAERSVGANLDINYDRIISKGFDMTLNQSFFYTSIADPVISFTRSDGTIQFVNALKTITTAGFETYLRMKMFEDFEIYLGYVFTDARKNYDTVNTFLSLNARNKASSVITFEPDEHWLIGIESSWIDWQYTDDHLRHPGYFIFAAMISCKIKNWRFVLNGENLLDSRQSPYIVTTVPPFSSSNPDFPQLWAPMDGRVINFSITYSVSNKKPK